MNSNSAHRNSGGYLGRRGFLAYMACVFAAVSILVCTITGCTNSAAARTYEKSEDAASLQSENFVVMENVVEKTKDDTSVRYYIADANVEKHAVARERMKYLYECAENIDNTEPQNAEQTEEIEAQVEAEISVIPENTNYASSQEIPESRAAPSQPAIDVVSGPGMTISTDEIDWSAFHDYSGTVLGSNNLCIWLGDNTVGDGGSSYYLAHWYTSYGTALRNLSVGDTVSIDDASYEVTRILHESKWHEFYVNEEDFGLGTDYPGMDKAYFQTCDPNNKSMMWIIETVFQSPEGSDDSGESAESEPVAEEPLDDISVPSEVISDEAPEDILENAESAEVSDVPADNVESESAE